MAWHHQGQDIYSYSDNLLSLYADGLALLGVSSSASPKTGSTIM